MNLFGLLIKLGALPVLLANIPEISSGSIQSPSLLGIDWLLIIIGFLGILFSDLLILRFGYANLYFSTKTTRLVDVGFYARNRHPSFWFSSSYYLGVLLHHSGWNGFTLLFWICLNVVGIVFLLTVQEKKLVRSFGKQYLLYKELTPFMVWKTHIAKNRSIKLLPQLIWLFGTLVLRNLYKIKTRGTEHIPHEKKFLVVANHESFLDPFLFGIFIPFEIKYVTTADVFTTPLFRFFLDGFGTFPMRRHRQDLKSIRTMIRMINNGQVVCIFPEGGRSIDGSPLPILKETLKLIQHCKVPILPVHLDGAYEIWPRWAPNRRRGHVTTTFKPIIPVKDQADLTVLEEHIRGAIFSSHKSFSHVKTHTITDGLDNFLWACSKCQARNSIEVTSGNTIKCQECETHWDVASDYTLTEVDSSISHTSISWIKIITADILKHPLTLDDSPALQTNESAFLHTLINQYVNDANGERISDLTLTLTNQRMILSNQAKIIDSWSLDNITIFTMDYNNAVSIGVGGIRHTFVLPENEITLKWQTYFDTLRAELD